MKFPKYCAILSAKPLAEYLHLPSITNSFFINPTDCNEVQIILLSSLDASKEPGPTKLISKQARLNATKSVLVFKRLSAKIILIDQPHNGFCPQGIENEKAF